MITVITVVSTSFVVDGNREGTPDSDLVHQAQREPACQDLSTLRISRSVCSFNQDHGDIVCLGCEICGG
jgi:hypothetical protein